MKAIRRGTKVRYIGKDELAQGREFLVLHRYRNDVEVMFPLRYKDGEVHLNKRYIPIVDVEVIEK